MKYAIAPNGVFWSHQTEGHLRYQMLFLRLAGCSVGCGGCDTDYTCAEKLSLSELDVRVFQASRWIQDKWVWLTGGEPADLPQDRQRALVDMLRAQGFSVAVATSGHKRFIPAVDWLSVSPHGPEYVQRYGNEIKLVEGLRGLDLNDAKEWTKNGSGFMYRYVQPLSVHRSGQWVEDHESLRRCLEFLQHNPDWSLSRQEHHALGIQ